MTAKIIKEGCLEWIHDKKPKLWKGDDFKVPVHPTGVIAIKKGDKHSIFFSNLHHHPIFSSIFSFGYNNHKFDKCPSYCDDNLIKKSEKYQAMTKCENFIIAATSLEGSSSNDMNIIYWDKDKKCTNILNMCDCIQGCKNTSICVKKELVKTVKYNSKCNCHVDIKLQGIACIESAKLMVFGLSHIKKCSHQQNNRAIIITVPYTINNNKLCLQRKFKFITELDFCSASYECSISYDKLYDLELSNICYDPVNENILVLTNYCKDNSSGGYLWTMKWFAKLEELSRSINIITEKNIDNNNKCHSESSQQCYPYHFNCIPRGVCHINGDEIIVVMDKQSPCKCCPSKKFKYDIINYMLK